MSETKWTPGPWSVIEEVDGMNLGRNVVGEGWVVAQCTTREEPLNDANAHLIAAVPELYEALGEVLAMFAGETPAELVENCESIWDTQFVEEAAEICQRARAVLAKARGEGE